MKVLAAILFLGLLATALAIIPVSVNLGRSYYSGPSYGRGYGYGGYGHGGYGHGGYGYGGYGYGGYGHGGYGHGYRSGYGYGYPSLSIGYGHH